MNTELPEKMSFLIFAKYPKNIRRGKSLSVSFTAKGFSPTSSSLAATCLTLSPKSSKSKPKTHTECGDPTPARLRESESKSAQLSHGRRLPRHPLSSSFLGWDFSDRFSPTQRCWHFPLTFLLQLFPNLFPLLWDPLLIILLPSVRATLGMGWWGVPGPFPTRLCGASTLAQPS